MWPSFRLQPPGIRSLKVFVTMPRDYALDGDATFRFIAEDKQSNERDVYSANFFSPEQ